MREENHAKKVGGEIEVAERVYDGEVVEGDVLRERPETVEDFVRLWNTTVRESEGKQWKLALIADTLVGSHSRGAVGQFALQTGYVTSRIYQLSKVWRLRSSMPEHVGEVGTLRNGRELTIQHFYEASMSDEPQEKIRVAQKNNWTASRLKLEVRNEENERSIAQRRQRALGSGAEDKPDRGKPYGKPGVKLSEKDAAALELGENLQSLRNRKRLTQGAVASKVGATRDQVAGYELGLELPDLRVLGRLCGLFDVTMDQVAGHLVPIPDWRSR